MMQAVVNTSVQTQRLMSWHGARQDSRPEIGIHAALILYSYSYISPFDFTSSSHIATHLLAILNNIVSVLGLDTKLGDSSS